MRWTPKPPRPQRTYGYLRRRLRFALFPLRVGDEVVWLERYWAVHKLIIPGSWLNAWLYKYRIVYEAGDPNLIAPNVGLPR